MGFKFKLDGEFNCKLRLGGTVQPGDSDKTIPKLASLSAKGLMGVTAFAERVPDNKWNYWQESNDDVKESATATATPTAHCLLLACVMHRGAVEIAGEGWTKIVTSEAATNGEDINQYMTVWTKQVKGGSHEVTVNSTDGAVRMSLKALAIYQTAGISVVENALIPAFPYTPVATTGKRRLYLTSSISASTSGSVKVDSSGSLDLRSAVESRFQVWYDYQPELETTPVFGVYFSGYNANSANIITIDIQEGD